jgi:hypothetical protein
MISPNSRPTTIRAKTQAPTDNSTLIATDAFVQNLTETAQINSLTIIGHSWTAGGNTTLNVPQFNMQNMIPRLMGLLNVNNENVTHLGTGASYLTKTVAAFGGRNTGWGGVWQFVIPYSNQNVNDQSTGSITLPNPQPSSFVMVHGVNDISIMGYDTSTVNMNQIRTAYKNAVRSVISRARAGTLYSSYYASGSAASVTWDSTITQSGFTSTAQTTSNTGVAVYRSSTNASTVTFTIPSNFTGGTIAMCFLGNKQAWTNINTNMNNTDVSTVVALTAFANTPYQNFANGDVVAWYSGGVDSGERGLITAGGGTNSVTITRGFNGTAKTTHAINDEMTTASSISVNFSTNGSNSTITGNLPLGTIGVPGQTNAYGQERVPVVKRFVCTAADAGKTITATVSAVASDTATVDFDSAWIEAFDPQPFVLANLPRYAYGAQQYVTEAQMTTWNSDVASVVAEFDASVQIADIDTVIHDRGGTLNTSITATQGTFGDANPTFTITAVNPTVFATLPQNSTLAIEGERLKAGTITNNNNGTFTLSNCTRGTDGTTAGTHASAKIISDGSFFTSDCLHLNAYGMNVAAKYLWYGFQSYQQQSPYSLSTGNGNSSDDRQRPQLGLAQNSYLAPAVTNLANTLIAFNTQTFMPIYIPQTCIIVQAGVIVTATGVTASTCRFGLYDLDAGRRGTFNLIHDFGTVSTVGTGFIAVNTYKMVKPGWYYVSSCEQGSGTASTKRCATGTAAGVGVAGYAGPPIASTTTPTGTTWVPTNGFTQASVTGAFAASVGSLSENTGSNPLVFLKVIARTWA